MLDEFIHIYETHIPSQQKFFKRGIFKKKMKTRALPVTKWSKFQDATDFFFFPISHQDLKHYLIDTFGQNKTKIIKESEGKPF